MNNKTATDIKNRFEEEKKNIEEYLCFLEYKISVLNSDLQKIEQLLVKYKFFESELKTCHLLFKNENSNKEEIRYNNIIKIKPQIEKRLFEIDKKLEIIPYPEKLNTVDIRTELGDLILVIKEEIQENNITDIDTLKKKYIKSLKPNEKELRLDLYYIKSIVNVESAVNYAVESATFIIFKEEYDDLLFVCGKLKHIDIMIKMSSKNEQLSIVRQGFILLMTVFDATIFDLMRIALSINFFKLIGFLGKNDKISLDNLSNYNSFDDFKDALIEEQLKKKYVKDILLILNKLDVNTVTDNKTNKDFAKLVELVLRRNIHVHNRGIVDERYLDKNIKEMPKFNIYGFDLGDYAKIDNKYLKEAIRLSKNCVEEIANWIEVKNCSVNNAT